MDFLLPNLSVLIKLCFVLCLIIAAVYNWRRRWLYYYSMKFPGPLSLPVIGTMQVAFAGQKDIFKVFEKLIKTCPKVWRLWIGNQMCIVSSRPQDVEILLTTCLKKEHFSLYDYNEENFSSIFTSRVDVWKVHRKIINPSFNQQIINSFIDAFGKYANTLTAELDKHCKESSIDVLPIVWSQTLDMLFETLADIEPMSLRTKNDDFIRMITRYEKLLTERFFNIFLHLNLFWKLSSYGKETKKVMKGMFDHISQLVELHHSQHLSVDSHDPLKDKRFLTQLLSKNLTSKEIEEETIFMSMAGSETTALIISSILLVMGIYPDIQEKVYEEQCTIFNDHTELTLEDVNRMDYLERVIKETMRLLPPAPYVARYIDKKVELENHTIPAGCGLIIPIWNIHKNSEHWPDPLKFDPDRFLPEEVAKRPRSSYLPFSYGPRNCIGLKYGMVSMKVMLSTIFRSLKVRPGKFKSIEDIEVEFQFVGKAKGGYRIALERRK